MMALYVASHYKNQPNDLQLMSDAPAHALFVLLPPLTGAAAADGAFSSSSSLASLARMELTSWCFYVGKEGAKTLGAEGATYLPEPLVVLQVALEGSISRDTILDGLGRGVRPGGDMIPWLISQQFQEPRFGKLSGARVVRVAVHPDYANVSRVSLLA
jgi:N-acetyltransferase 10